MLELVDCGCILTSTVSLCIAVKAKRKQVLLLREIDSANEQLRAIACRLETLPAKTAPDEKTRVRHDLMTPLTSVMGFCALLRQTSSELSPKQERMLKNIDESARQMLEVVGATSHTDSRP